MDHSFIYVVHILFGGPLLLYGGYVGKLLSEKLGEIECKIIIEPGRFLTANSAILVTKIIYIRTFIFWPDSLITFKFEVNMFP